MESTKQQALQAISNLPDETSMDEIMYRLYVLDCIKKGQDAVEKGSFISADELLKGSRKW